MLFLVGKTFDKTGQIINGMAETINQIKMCIVLCTNLGVKYIIGK